MNMNSETRSATFTAMEIFNYIDILVVLSLETTRI